MLHRFVLHNHALQEASDRTLVPSQVGLLSGWGVFSTMRIVDGVLFAWERHWARMKRDAAALHVPFPTDPAPLHRRLLELVDANGAWNATMRLVVVRNNGGMWSGPHGGGDSDVLALTADAREWGRGVKLGYVRHARHAACPFAGTKSLSWSANLAWLESTQARGFDEALLLNEHGHVAECTSANVFAAVGDKVFTPPLTSGCLPGVTREVLLEELRAPGFELVEANLLPADLESADEVFISSTTRELLRVDEIEGRSVGRNDVARGVLQTAFSDYVASYVAARKQV